MNTFKEEKKTLFCLLEEKLDTITCQKLEWDLDMHLGPQYEMIVFDLEHTFYVSSTFLRICLKMVNHFGKERFSVINVSPGVMEVFAMANLTEICKPA